MGWADKALGFHVSRDVQRQQLNTAVIVLLSPLKTRSGLPTRRPHRAAVAISIEIGRGSVPRHTRTGATWHQYSYACRRIFTRIRRAAADACHYAAVPCKRSAGRNSRAHAISILCIVVSFRSNYYTESSRKIRRGMYDLCRGFVVIGYIHIPGTRRARRSIFQSAHPILEPREAFWRLGVDLPWRTRVIRFRARSVEILTSCSTLGFRNRQEASLIQSCMRILDSILRF